jgi:uncharacterized membrane protein YesL
MPDFSRPFLRSTLADAYSDFGELLTFNFWWVLLTLPVLTAPPAAAGLFFATHQLARGEPVTWRTFWQGFRAGFWQSYAWALVNLLAAALVAANLWFYGSFDAAWAQLAQGLGLGAGVLWLLLALLVWPLLLVQHDRRLRTALRNSLVLYLKRPGLCLQAALVLGLVVAASTRLIPPAWLVITGALSAFLLNRTVLAALDSLGELRPEPEAPDLSRAG